MKKIILFKTNLQKEKFFFLFGQSQNSEFMLFEDFLLFYLDEFEKFFGKNFAQKKFKKIDFDFFFWNFLTILIDLNLVEFLDFFHSQKNQIKKIFDDFWKKASDQNLYPSEDISNFIKIFFKNLESKFSKSETDDKFFDVLQKVFYEFFIKFHQNHCEAKIYASHFDNLLIKFFIEIFEIHDYNFENSFKQIKGKIKEVSLWQESSFKDYLKEKLISESFYGFH